MERNVDYRSSHAKKALCQQSQSGELIIVGGVCDFNNLYGKCRETLMITNINGTNVPNAILNGPALKDLSGVQDINHVDSLAPGTFF